jgi:hypothetical protein
MRRNRLDLVQMRTNRSHVSFQFVLRVAVCVWIAEVSSRKLAFDSFTANNSVTSSRLFSWIAASRPRSSPLCFRSSREVQLEYAHENAGDPEK